MRTLGNQAPVPLEISEKLHWLAMLTGTGELAMSGSEERYHTRMLAGPTVDYEFVRQTTWRHGHLHVVGLGLIYSVVWFYKSTTEVAITFDRR